MTSIRLCPDLARYQRLASGELAPPESESLLSHLEGCESCVRWLESLPDSDTLVRLFRQAGADGDRPAAARVARLIAKFGKLRPDFEAAKTGAVPIVVNCPGCGKRLKARVNQAGKSVRCPKCHATLAVPAAAVPGDGPTIFPAGSETAAPVEAANATAIRAVGPTGSDHVPEPDSRERELCAFLAPAQAPDELGRLGPYRVLEILGAGGMGVVFRAEDPQLNRPVALKAMLPAMAASASGRERFLREARVAAGIKHDHVVAIYQVGEDRGAPFLAMELLDGEPLDKRLRREGQLPVADVLRIGREAALGLTAAHERGLIHRDIKPANLWLERKGEPGASGSWVRVKILDFGLARPENEKALTQSGAIVGTPQYMAPEQVQNRDLDARCDLFSLGCLLYRLATGRLPFAGTDMISTLMAVANDEPPPPRELEPRIPPTLSKLILRLLAKDREQRPRSAAAVAAELERIDRYERARPGLARARERLALSYAAWSAKRRPRWLWLAGAAGGLLALVLAGGVVVRVMTDKGQLVITTQRPDVEVVVSRDGKMVQIVDAETKQTISLPSGPYEVGLAKAEKGLSLSTDRFTITRGGEALVEVRWERPTAAPAGNSPATREETPRLTAADKPKGARETEAQNHSLEPDWLTNVAALPALQQARAVEAKLKERNPEFNGRLFPAIESGVVKGVQLSCENVQDITPLRAFTHLSRLNLGTDKKQKGKLRDLTPLQGMKLTELNLNNSPHLEDLTPLQGMPVTSLDLGDCVQLRDLTPLQGMPLKFLNICWLAQLWDLTPLHGMPLTELHAGHCPHISDLSPLRGMPLALLNCDCCAEVGDLTPLQGMPLTYLHIYGTRVHDLTPLRGMKLTFLQCGGTQVADLAPLQGMKLQELHLMALREVNNLQPLDGMPLGYLDLNATGASDTCIAPLKNCKTLKHLHVRDTAISPRGIEALKRALPGCKIEWDGNVSERKASQEGSLSPDGQAAEAVLALGGTVTIRLHGHDNSIGPGRPLPAGDFQLIAATPPHDVRLSDGVVEALGKATNLVGLNLSAVCCGRDAVSPITDGGLAHLASLKKLKYLNLFNTRITDAGLAHLHELSNLRYLDLWNTGVTDNGIASLEGLTRLETLGLGVTAVTDGGLVHLQGLSELKILRLGAVKQISNAGVRHLRGLKNLTVLALDDTQVTKEVFVELKELPNLRELDLRATAVADSGLEELRHVSQLKYLGLRATRVKDQDLAHVKLLVHLESLDLGDTRIGNSGLAHLSGLSQLKSLDLTRTRIRDAGLAQLKNLSRIERLILEGTIISDAALTHLEGMSNLNELNLTGTRVTAPGVRKLSRALPACKINWGGGVIDPNALGASDGARRQ